MQAQDEIRKILSDHLQDLKSKNPYFSLRAFAKRLDVSPGTLSLILAGKRKVSKKLGSKIVEKLCLSPEAESHISELFVLDKLHKNSQRVEALPRNQFLDMDKFEIISGWEHLAITQLIDTDDFVSDCDWISSRLGISKKRVKLALERLEKLDIIKIKDNGDIVDSSEIPFKTTDGIKNRSLRKAHKERLELAAKSIDSGKIKTYDHTGLTLAFNPEKMDLARDIIREFEQKFAEAMNVDELSEVYALNVNFFPLSITGREYVQ
ncbi:MAG: TIGR02147 family protein [Bacteriovoracaceae bacterium]|jgi:uncharacterized protein (TIGR02147 family)|nr:TIGR02147 family protein [Bacteriovoracaceae bacterium]